MICVKIGSVAEEGLAQKLKTLQLFTARPAASYGVREYEYIMGETVSTGARRFKLWGDTQAVEPGHLCGPV